MPLVKMRIHKRNVLLLTCGLSFMVLTWIAVLNVPSLGEEDLLQKKLSELRDRVQFIDALNKEREIDIVAMRKKFYVLHKQLSKVSISNASDQQTMLPLYIREILTNLSVTQFEIQPPNIFHFMPHLNGHPEALVPNYKISKAREGVSIVLGIPTIKREKSNYLFETLKSLLDGLNVKEQRDCLIIVFIAEPDDVQYVRRLSHDIKQQFSSAMDSGLIEIISPSSLFYPDFENIRQTFGDSKERVKWRTKQNLDYAFLMMYARNKGTYYAQLEDDIITKPGFFSVMKNFALNQKTEDWMLLEFSLLGFIGKLFKSADLPIVIEFFLMFYKDKPIDWLLEHLLYVKSCNPEKDNKHCERMKANIRIKYKPSLFQHVGTHSSLKGKVQKLKDRYFGAASLHRAHVNPLAEVSTTLKVYRLYGVDRCYRGETFFWGLIPHAGDVVVLKFSPSIEIGGFYFKSGNAEHPGDQFFNTSVEILTDRFVEKDSGLVDNSPVVMNYPQTTDGYFVVGNFTMGIAEGTLSPDLGKVQILRLMVHSESKNWVILSEIHIKLSKTKRNNSSKKTKL